jgi:hypothetical protein
MRVYHFWVKFFHAEDDPRAWVAHCLDLDVITWGYSVPETLHLAHEAIMITVVDELAGGHDDWSDRRAPKEMWDDLYAALKSPVPRTLQSLAEDTGFDGVFYANIAVAVPDEVAPEDPPKPSDGEPRGVAMVA